MKIFAGLKLYPHGFLGAPLETPEPQLNKPIQIDVIGTATRSVKLESSENLLRPHKAINDIYEKVISDPKALQDFALKERLYYEALRVFGTVTLQDWIERQKQNPYFDTWQNRFLDETIGYIYEGHRRYHVSVYLTSMQIGRVNSFKVGEKVQKWVKDVNGKRPILIKDMIQSWLSQDDGLTDMVTSLFIMFGESK